MVGDEFQPVPVSLEILYFSYLEDTFYEGQFPLPQQRIGQLLRAGFWHHRQQQLTYDELMVCVLPKGAVVVWLAGVGRQVLVGRYQGKVAPVDFRRFYPKSDRAELLRYTLAEAAPAIRAQAQAGTLSARQWDDYLQTYAWQVALPPTLKLTYYRTNFLSGEYIAEPETRDMAAYVQDLLTSQVRPVPSRFSLSVTDEADHKYILAADALDEAEVQAAFRQLHAAHPGAPLTLHVETDKYVKAVSLVLEAGGQRIALTKSAVRIVT